MTKTIGITGAPPTLSLSLLILIAWPSKDCG